MEDRIIDLEIKLAYQDKKIGELEDLLRALALRLDTTERELAELKRAPAGGGEPVDDRPPHY
jgi:uncharacterized coiled-coil protein SlyX